jgi:hypothetical protein
MKENEGLPKKSSPEKDVAQRLANLLGTSVLGFVPNQNTPLTPSATADGFSLPPSSMLPKLSLDTELFRHNMSIAEIIILSGLIHNNPAHRKNILDSTKKEYFPPKLFEGFLFEALAETILDNFDIEISTDFLFNQIHKYFSVQWNSSPESDGYVRDILFRYAQAVDINPSAEQIDKAIQLRRIWAHKKGIV